MVYLYIIYFFYDNFHPKISTCLTEKSCVSIAIIITIIINQQEMCMSAQCRWTQSMYVYRREISINTYPKNYLDSTTHTNKIEVIFIRGEGKLFSTSLFT